MNYNTKHEKVAKIIARTTFENFIESLAAIEYNLCLPIQEPAKCLVPLEANFQLPNVFLKTKLNFKSDKILSNDAMKANWNTEIAKVCDFLENIELEVFEERKELMCDEKNLEELIKWRQGTNI